MIGRLLTLLVLLGLAVPARAEESRYGAAVDLGVPDGLMASFAYRAHEKLSTQAGIGHNGNSPGLRVGLRYLPVEYLVRPYLALEGGYYFEAQTSEWMRDAAKEAGLKDKTLDRAGYQYANGHLGAQIGAGKISVILQMGVSFVRANALIIKPKPNYSPPVELYRDTTINAWLVSGRLGLQFGF